MIVTFRAIEVPLLPQRDESLIICYIIFLFTRMILIDATNEKCISFLFEQRIIFVIFLFSYLNRSSLILKYVLFTLPSYSSPQAIVVIFIILLKPSSQL